MKRWLLLTLVFLAIAVACLYFIIPNTIIVVGRDGVAVNAKAFSRTFLNEANWKQWWPGTVLTKGNKHFGRYEYNGFIYSIVEKKLSSVVFSIRNEKDSFTSELVFLPMRTDSVSLAWQGRFITSPQPINRLQQYFETRRIDKDITTILEKIRVFYSDETNVYGLKIIKDHVLDSTLISIFTTTKEQPTVELIYKLIDQLKAFAQAKGAHQTGLPMLNVTTIDSITYLTKVALPIDKKLKDEGKIVYRWMLGGGNILVAEVKGGPHTIKRGFEIVEKYTEDHNRLAPAIPFQSMVTDRRLEPDTGKWVTRIYWPVM